ncbi:hypothetical protein QBC32DRAFT_330843 [Pseudoneurospora amorphoporcata]|uniref:Uncharacterized protein n=1 Tax=Pseudoneurospora amorphoporcata TaxID=241081 RepID=A0AAN6SKL8_9PEZI|nr:hypothetical protein QBC32DRAFT_330843 [Pseudoneurospora amorphoporcata]
MRRKLHRSHIDRRNVVLALVGDFAVFTLFVLFVRCDSRLWFHSKLSLSAVLVFLHVPSGSIQLFFKNHFTKTSRYPKR